MNRNLTDIVLIVDRSGSMNESASDTIGTINSFIEEQKKLPGEATVTLVLFNEADECVFARTPLTAFPTITSKEYRCSGMTALIDAACKAIENQGAHYARMRESYRPGKVIVAIITDGEENSSREYTQAQLKAMIEEQTTKYSWEFLFLGANIDTFAVAGNYGIAAMNTMSYTDTADLALNSRTFLNATVSTYRSN
jgi:uncharacterized protein YegL